MAFEMIIVKGLKEDFIKQLAVLSSTMEKRFDEVDRRFEQIDTRLDRVEGMLTQILEYLSEKP
jgi:chaperonin cofactor prefoldin